jgi:uncharacterized membrane protein SirB2
MRADREEIDVHAKTVAAGWLAVALLPLTAFLLLSFAVLPVKWTNRHYITVCFTLAVACLQVSCRRAGSE